MTNTDLGDTSTDTFSTYGLNPIEAWFGSHMQHLSPRKLGKSPIPCRPVILFHFIQHFHVFLLPARFLNELKFKTSKLDRDKIWGIQRREKGTFLLYSIGRSDILESSGLCLNQRYLAYQRHVIGQFSSLF